MTAEQHCARMSGTTSGYQQKVEKWFDISEGSINVKPCESSVFHHPMRFSKPNLIRAYPITNETTNHLNTRYLQTREPRTNETTCERRLKWLMSKKFKNGAVTQRQGPSPAAARNR